MDTMNKMQIVAKHVFLKRIKTLSYWFTILGPIILAIIIGIIGAFMGSGINEDSIFNTSSGSTIAVISDDQKALRSINSRDNVPYQVEESVKTEEQAKEQLEQEEIVGYVVITKTDNTLQPTFYYQKDEQNKDIEQALSKKLTHYQSILRLNESGLSSSEIDYVNEAVKLESKEVDLSPESDKDLKKLVGSIVAMLIMGFTFMFILVYVGIIVEEIAQEKGSHIMEIILSSVTASKHFFGKLLGLIYLMLVHVLVYAVPLSLVILFYNYFLTGTYSEFIQSVLNELPDGTIDIIIDIGTFGIIFLILAILMYISVAGLLGSLATKTEDAGKVVWPLTAVILIGFYITYFSFIGGGLDGIVLRVASYIPLFTPLIMPYRIALGSVSGLEIALTIGWTILSTLMIIYFSVQFYQSSVLVYTEEGLINAIKQALSIRKGNKKAQNKRA